MKCYQFNNVKIKAIYKLTPNMVRWQIHPYWFLSPGALQAAEPSEF